MKISFFQTTIPVACLLGLMATSAGLSADEQVKQVLADYVDNTVIKTYTELADKAMVLNEKVASLEVDTTDANISAAAEAWLVARNPWEQSEAFLFGPAAFNDLDPQLDSWPLDQAQVDFVISSIAEGKLEVDAGYVRDYLGSGLRGFHAIEYLLFKDGQPRTADQLSDAEKAYLVAVTQVLMEDCITLEAWWTGADALSDEKKAVLEAAEIETSGSYGNEFKSAGEAGSRYDSQQAALLELVQGCMDIADELGTVKIAEPAETQNPLYCESWYSWNSLTDFLNNIQGIENAYMGGVEDARGASVSDLIAAKNPELDTKVKSTLEDADAKISAIGNPFRNNLGKTEEIEAAAAACANLVAVLEEVSGTLQ